MKYPMLKSYVMVQLLFSHSKKKYLVLNIFHVAKLQNSLQSRNLLVDTMSINNFFLSETSCMKLSLMPDYSISVHIHINVITWCSLWILRWSCRWRCLQILGSVTLSSSWKRLKGKCNNISLNSCKYFKYVSYSVAISFQSIKSVSWCCSLWMLRWGCSRWSL